MIITIFYAFITNFKKEILKWLNAEIMYLISNSQWVSLVHIVPKKAGVTVNTFRQNDEFVLTIERRIL